MVAAARRHGRLGRRRRRRCWCAGSGVGCGRLGNWGRRQWVRRLSRRDRVGRWRRRWRPALPDACRRHARRQLVGVILRRAALQLLQQLVALDLGVQVGTGHRGEVRRVGDGGVRPDSYDMQPLHNQYDRTPWATWLRDV